MRAIAVDWSGARSPGAQRRGIWVAEAVDGDLRELTAGRTRDETARHLLEIADTAGVIGLDFSFGFPSWWATQHGAATGPDMWEVVTEVGEEWLARCDPPFWGRPGRARPPLGGPALRRCELDVPEGLARPKSIFQIGGAGSVGTGSIRGMPVLTRLRSSGLAVWPFDPRPATGPVVVEAYPRWCTGPVVKSQPAARAAHLARRWPGLSGSLLASAAMSEDAFDAACTALTLSVGTGPPAGALDHVDALEGRVIAPVVCTVSGPGSSVA